MPIDTFLHAVKQLAETRLDVMAVIGSAETLYQAGRPDLASQLYQLWINCNPGNPLLKAVFYNLGISLAAAGDQSGARCALEQSLEIEPDFHPARINLGVFFANAGNIDQALEHWSVVVEQLDQVNSTNIRYKKMVLAHIAHHLEQSFRYADAEAALKHSLELDCHQTEVVQHWLSLRQEQCLWPVVVPLEGVDRKTMLQTMLPLSLVAYADDPILQLASAWNYSRTIKPPKVNLVFSKDKDESASVRRRKVGYLSSDLRAHAVGSLVAEVFELHNREEFEIFAYYCGPPSNDALNARLKDAIEHWVNITGMSDEAAAKRIAEDNVDILVDINGHTRDARTAVVFMHPAPIIVNWLGYPGTMGSPFHHYIIADDWIVPQDHEIYYSEKVLRLPCYQSNDRKRPSVMVPQNKKDCGLPDDSMVYCCFNSTHKITKSVFLRWMQILQRVPNSVLWLFEQSEVTSQHLRSLAEENSVSSERLVFAKKLPNPSHLARLQLADLFLDTAPYGAHTTGSDALWMGLPVLTLSGRSFVSRVCGSLVRSAGIPELVCTTPEEYVERAVELGQNQPLLRRIKDKLSSNRASCILFDMELLVRSLERLYQSMWSDFNNGRLPIPDLTNLDTYLEIGSEQLFDEENVSGVEDYHEHYLSELVRRNRLQPIAIDRRLWNQSSVAPPAVEGFR